MCLDGVVLKRLRVRFGGAAAPRRKGYGPVSRTLRVLMRNAVREWWRGLRLHVLLFIVVWAWPKHKAPVPGPYPGTRCSVCAAFFPVPRKERKEA